MLHPLPLLNKMASTNTRKKTSSAGQSIKKEVVGIFPSRPASTASATTKSPASSSSAGWSNAQKAQLFEHVCKVGETEWGLAVEGKTAQQASRSSLSSIHPALVAPCTSRCCGLVSKAYGMSLINVEPRTTEVSSYMIDSLLEFKWFLSLIQQEKAVPGHQAPIWVVSVETGSSKGLPVRSL